MDEQKKSENTKPEAESKDTPKRNIPEPNDKIDRANAAAQRMEEANAKKAELLDREEALQVERTLGGTATAGQESTEKEETPEEYAEKVMGNKI